MAKDTSFLDKDTVPTIEEMKKFFQSNDFTTEVSSFDPDKAGEGALWFYNMAQEHFRKAWNEQMKALGGNGSMLNMSHNDPLRVLENADEQLVLGTVMQIASDESLFESILMNFCDNCMETICEKACAYAELHEKSIDDLSEEEMGIVFDSFADDVLSKMMSYMQQVQSVPEILEALNGNRAHEDFNENIIENYDKIDFERQWYHLRTKIQILFCMDELIENEDIDPYHALEDTEAMYDPAKQAEEDREILERFLNTLDDDIDRQIVKMRIQGMTQEAIAEKLGFKTHSAVHKRLEKLYIKCCDFTGLAS